MYINKALKITGSIIMSCFAIYLNAQDYHIRGTIENSDVDITLVAVDGSELPAYEINYHPDGLNYYTIKFTETLPGTGSFQIRAGKTEESPNGVSTLDMVHVMRHILALNPYENLGQLFASDTNQDGKVSAIDMIKMRRWILGQDQDGLWNFFTKNPRLVDILENDPNKLPQGFHEIDYNSLPQENIDFFGIKIGDVNNTADSN